MVLMFTGGKNQKPRRGGFKIEKLHGEQNNMNKNGEQNMRCIDNWLSSSNFTK